MEQRRPLCLQRGFSFFSGIRVTNYKMLGAINLGINEQLWFWLSLQSFLARTQMTKQKRIFVQSSIPSTVAFQTIKNRVVENNKFQ